MTLLLSKARFLPNTVHLHLAAFLPLRLLHRTPRLLLLR